MKKMLLFSGIIFTIFLASVAAYLIYTKSPKINSKSKISDNNPPADNSKNATIVKGNSSVNVQTQTIKSNENGIIFIDVMPDANKEISAVEFYIQFDPQLIEIATDDNGKILPQIIRLSPEFKNWTPLVQSIFNNEIRLAYFCNPVGDNCNFLKSDKQINFAQIKYKAIGQPGTKAEFKFIDSPQHNRINAIVSINPSANILKNKLPGTISIN